MIPALPTGLIRGAMLLAVVSGTLHADTRTSANYRLTTETVDAGGVRHASANYRNEATAGGIAGTATVASPVLTTKAGYVGQLYEKVSLTVAAAPGTVNEAGTRQVSAELLLDDATTLAVDATAVTWTVVSGPVVGVTTAGLATAGTVYQNDAATVQGVHAGFTGTVNLSVLNVSNDDLAGYGGDGLPDDWQVLHYGLNNSQAAPDAAPDGTGETNLFKYAAGLVPFDRNSRFTTNLEPVSGQPGFYAVVFGPLAAGRTYTVQYKTSLTDANWTTLTGGTSTDASNYRTVTDPTPLATARFYRVQIAVP